MVEYEEAKKIFIDEYKNANNSDSLKKVIIEVVIPYFGLLACDLDELIDSINEINNVTYESLDYIESLFNPNLYNTIMKTIKDGKQPDTCKHYFIILIESIKCDRYLIIQKNLTNFENNQVFAKSILYDTLIRATEERKALCVERIRNTHKDLMDNHPDYNLSKVACQELFNSEHPPI